MAQKRPKTLTVEMTANAKIDIDTVGLFDRQKNSGEIFSLPFATARDLIAAGKAKQTTEKPRRFGKGKGRGKAPEGPPAADDDPANVQPAA